MKFEVKKIHKNATLPKRQTPGSAGLDLSASHQVEVSPGSAKKIPTGITIAIPEGYEGQIRPRSGLASRGIVIPNAPATIDSDFRGEILVLLRNRTEQAYSVRWGDRIAQLVIAPVVMGEPEEVEELEETERGGGGFGSTGI